MSLYKIHIGADGAVRGFGPNVDAYQPYLEDGDSLAYSDTPPGPSENDMFITLRAARNAKLRATDKYLLPDYPIAADALEQVKAYRAALRALPEQPGAPWPGGDVPWPVMPTVGA